MSIELEDYGNKMSVSQDGNLYKVEFYDAEGNRVGETLEFDSIEGININFLRHQERVEVQFEVKQPGKNACRAAAIKSS